ncbi:MAG: HAD-IIB family hydrolase [Lachnospiraceae bacterium]|nr:HAD-IIB family hydrolase [Lachnospiraceae bacterium]
MNKKYFFFDIDGTLTDRKTNRIVPSALEAVNRLKAAGHFVSLATGRALYKADLFRRQNGFENMVCNGGHGIVIDNKVKENRPIVYEKALALYRQAEELGFGILTALDDSKKVYAKDFRFYEQVGIRKEPTTYIIDSDFDPGKEAVIYKMYIAVPENEEDKMTLAKEYKDDIGYIRFEPEYLIFQPDAKLEGILRMLSFVGGTPEDVVVFGDDYNDLCMFDERFYRVAMGNGCDALKEKADYVAPLNIEDGIFRTCEEHGWF